MHVSKIVSVYVFYIILLNAIRCNGNKDTNLAITPIKFYKCRDKVDELFQITMNEIIKEQKNFDEHKSQLYKMSANLIEITVSNYDYGLLQARERKQLLIKMYDLKSTIKKTSLIVKQSLNYLKQLKLKREDLLIKKAIF